MKDFKVYGLNQFLTNKENLRKFYNYKEQKNLNYQNLFKINSSKECLVWYLDIRNSCQKRKKLNI